jgi:hypothetical protein
MTKGRHQTNKGFSVLFFKKEQAFFLKKEAKALIRLVFAALA